MEKELLVEILENSLSQLIAKDRHLIDTNASERSMVNRLAYYLSSEKKLNEWDIDTEYNRQLDHVKKTGDKIVVPDLIIHKRGSMKENLLVLEVKKSNAIIESDVEKVHLIDRPVILGPPSIYNYHTTRSSLGTMTSGAGGRPPKLECGLTVL